MPQLDIALTILWYIFIIFGLGVLYLQNVYIYIPTFIRGWKVRSFYVLSLTLEVVSLYIITIDYIRLTMYSTVSCSLFKYGYIVRFIDNNDYSYILDVDSYVEY